MPSILFTTPMAIISSKENSKGKSYFAFFDLDRTLIRETSGTALVRGALRKNLLSLGDISKALLLSFEYKSGLYNPLSIINKMTTWVKGLPEKVMDDLASEVCEKVLLPSVFKSGRDEIGYHHDRNAGTVILSSSLTPVCLRVRDYLGIDDVICSDLEVVNGVYTGRSNGPLCFGAEKANQLRIFCEINDCSPEKSWYYGDSESDIPVMEVVGHPNCINPDRRLRKMAARKAWKVNYWE
ncbi:MAG: HAD-IB family hydrolase [Bacteroidales bacterium]